MSGPLNEWFPIYVGTNCAFDTSLVTSSSGTLTFDIYGPFLYAVDDAATDRLKIWDISNPLSPVLKSNTVMGTGLNPWMPKYHDGLLLVPCVGTEQLKIYDVSNPSSPSLLSTITVSTDPWGVAAIGDTACVASYFTGVAERIDISDPSNPVLTHTWAGLGGTCTGVEAAGNTHFMVTGQQGSGGPTYIAALTESDLTLSDSSHDGNSFAGLLQYIAVNAAGTLAFTTNGGNSAIDAWDISNKSNLTLLEHAVIVGGAGDTVLAYRESNDRVYAGRVNGGGLQIAIIDVSDPSNMAFVGSIDTSGEAVADIQVVEDDCATLAYAQGTGAAIFLIGQPPES